MKNLKFCKGFKPNTYTVLSFLHNCVKSCPTVVQLQIIRISPWWTNQIRKRFLIWIILSRYKCLRKQFYFLNKLGKSVFPNLEMSLSRLRRIEKSQLFAKRFEIVSPTIWGKSASPVLVSLCYGFAELRFRQLVGENIQLNIDYIREPILVLF